MLRSGKLRRFRSASVYSGCSGANLSPLGVWRSLVARSVRVGEVPSSNLGTPIESRGNQRFPRENLGPPGARHRNESVTSSSRERDFRCK